MVRRTKEDAEKTRTAILDAAEKVFLKIGVSKTSLEAIARAAGVTRGAVYWHFRDKTDLLEALLARARLPVADVISQLGDGDVTAPPDSVLNDVQQACLTAIRLLQSDPRRRRVYTILMHRCEAVGDVLKWRRKDNREMQRLMISAFELAQAQGELAPPWTPETAAHATSMMMHGMLRNWLEDPSAFNICEEGAACVDSLFASMRRHGLAADAPRKIAGARS